MPLWTDLLVKGNRLYTSTVSMLHSILEGDQYLERPHRAGGGSSRVGPPGDIAPVSARVRLGLIDGHGDLIGQ